MSNAADARDAAAGWWGRMHGPDSETLRPEFERWRAADPRHAAEYARLERTWDLAAGLSPAASDRPRTLRREPRPMAWATAPRIALAAAAMIVVALFVTLRPTSPAYPSIVSEAHATAVGEIRTFKLSDGSSVTLDTDTRITVAFDGKERRVRLERGRARFAVKPDGTRSFVVEADGKLLSAQASGFDVELAATGLCVTALEGAVEVRPSTLGLAGPPELRLEAGRALRFVKGQPQVAAEPAGKGSGQWVSGMLVFQGAPLSAVLDETSRYSRRRIRVAEASLGALRVTGTFRPLPVEQLAASLAAAFGLSVRQDAGGDLILARP